MLATPTALPEVLILDPVVHGDERGYFYEAWNQRTFNAVTGLEQTFVQDNQSLSRQGVVRGLHYQLPNPQAKLVRVLRGSIWDVAVDIRRSSTTFGQWVGVELSAGNRKILWVPEGFAHGFAVTSPEAEIFYKTTDYFDPGADRGIRWDDETLAIDWPVTDPVLSDKDIGLPTLAEARLFE